MSLRIVGPAVAPVCIDGSLQEATAEAQQLEPSCSAAVGHSTHNLQAGDSAPPAGFANDSAGSCFVHAVGQCVARTPPSGLLVDLLRLDNGAGLAAPVTAAFGECVAALRRPQRLQWPCRAVAVDGKPLRRTLAATAPTLGTAGPGDAAAALEALLAALDREGAVVDNGGAADFNSAGHQPAGAAPPPPQRRRADRFRAAFGGGVRWVALPNSEVGQLVRAAVDLTPLSDLHVHGTATVSLCAKPARLLQLIRLCVCNFACGGRC